MGGLAFDFRYAFRTLRHGGLSSVIAVLSLAIGAGANAALFSVGDAMLIRPLPYPNADRLVILRPINPSHGVFWTTVAPANLIDWQAQAKSFEAIAAYRWWTVDLIGHDRSERLRGLRTTPEFFKVLGVPLQGRTFASSDPRQVKPEIVIGQGLRRRRFASDAGLLGRLLDLNIINLSRVGSTPFSVVGIALADV